MILYCLECEIELKSTEVMEVVKICNEYHCIFSYANRCHKCRYYTFEYEQYYEYEKKISSIKKQIEVKNEKTRI